MARIIFILLISALHVNAQQGIVKLTHYALDNFAPGTVKMKSGAVYQQVLNYNILTEEVIFENGNTLLAVSDQQNIDTVIIAGRTFVPVNKVFYELLDNAKLPLLMEYTYTIREPGTSVGYGITSSTTSAAAIKDLIQSGGAYSLKLPDNFEVLPGYAFWVRKDGKYMKFGNAQQLAKIFPDKKDKIKELVAGNHTDFSKRNDVILLLQQVQQ